MYLPGVPTGVYPTWYILPGPYGVHTGCIRSAYGVAYGVAYREVAYREVAYREVSNRDLTKRGGF